MTIDRMTLDRIDIDRIDIDRMILDIMTIIERVAFHNFAHMSSDDLEILVKVSIYKNHILAIILEILTKLSPK